MRVQDLERLTRPGLSRSGRRLGLRNERLGPQNRVAVPEERIRIGDAVVGTAGDPQHGLAAAQVCKREFEPPDHEPVAGRDQLGRVIFVVPESGSTGQPEPVFPPLRRPKRREHEDVAGIELLAVSERFEDRAAGELLRCVAEHRPVCNLARRRSPRADAVEEPARPTGREPVEVGRRGDLVGGAPAERIVGTVGEPIEEDDEDRIHRAEASVSLSRFRHDPVTHACDFRKYDRSGEEVEGAFYKGSNGDAIELAKDAGHSRRYEQLPVAA